MKSEHIRQANVAPWLLATALMLGSCSESPERAKLEHARRLMNDRKYLEAIGILEPAYESAPSDPQVIYLLATANLGASGVEMLPLVDNVTRASVNEESARALLSPTTCAATNNSVNLETVESDFVCGLSQTLDYAPDPDNPYLTRTRTLMRKGFADPSNTSPDVNTVAAIAELISVVGRIKVLLGLAIDQEKGRALAAVKQFPYDLAIRHLRALAVEASQGLRRILSSYSAIATQVTQWNGRNIVKIGSQTLVFRTTPDLEWVQDFFVRLVDEYSMRFSQQERRFLTERQAGYQLLRRAADVDVVHFKGRALAALQALVRLDDLRREVAARFPSTASQANINTSMFRAFLQNPPNILRNLRHAIETSWNDERSDSLASYLDETEEGWTDAESLGVGWRLWLDRSLTKAQREQFLTLFSNEIRGLDGRVDWPESPNTQALVSWQRNLVAKAKGVVAAVTSRRVALSPELAAPQINSLLSLAERTEAWLNRYLFEDPAQQPPGTQRTQAGRPMRGTSTPHDADLLTSPSALNPRDDTSQDIAR